MSAVLMLLSFLLFAIAAVGVASGRVNLIAAGLAFYVAAQLVGVFGR